MNTQAKDFTNEFKGIKREVLAMKQYHGYGLNRTNFDIEFVEKHVSSAGVNYRFVITFDTNSNSQPYIQLNSYDFDYAELYIYTWDWDGDNKTLTLTGYYRNFHYVSVQHTEIGIVSAVPILSYTWEETQ